MTFQCKEGCHECCILPPLPKSFLLKYQHLVKGKGIEVIEDMGACFVLTEDYLCPFHQEGKCVVYDVRPKVCRQYGVVKSMPCIYITKSGRERTEVEQKRIAAEWEEKRMRIKMLQNDIRKH